MSRTSHLYIGIGLCLFSFVCLWCGYMMFLMSAIGKDSVPGARLFDGGTIIIFILFGGPGVGALWFAFRNFKRAFQPPPRQRSEPLPRAEQAPGVPTVGTPDERLAYLVKKPDR